MRRTFDRFALTMAVAVCAPAIHAMDVVVAQVGPLSGIDANQGRAYGDGVELYFKEVNDSGGVNGHHFVLVRKDDGGRPEDTIAITKELIAKNKPLALTGYFGSKNVSDLIAANVLQQQRIALVGYRTSDIRPETPYLYSVRANLREELNKLTEHFGTIGVTKLGLLYEAGPGAAAIITATDEAARKANTQVVQRAAYAEGTAKVAPAVEQFLKSQPQAILLVASGGAAAGFIEQYRGAGGTAQIFTHSGADVEQMAKRLSEEQLQGVGIAQVTPNPYRISSRVAKELNDLLLRTGKIDVPVSYSMIEGFIAAKVIVEAVRRQGRTPTREGVAATLDKMGSHDVGGYVVGFKPGMHTGSRYVELSIVSRAGRIRQ
jgi:branched-chain amino acid transport system substrate-binding protein